jgi:hypothetical protein
MKIRNTLSRTLCFALVAAWAAMPALGGIRLVLTEHGCTLSTAERQKIEEMLNTEWSFFRNLFPLEETVEFNLHLFGDRQEYDRCYDTYKCHPPRVNRPSGIYHICAGETIVYKDQAFCSTIQHEASHFLYHLKVANPPVWLNEGLATYFGQARMEGGRVIVDSRICNRCGRAHFWEPLGRRLSAGQLVPLSQFFTLGRGEWNLAVEQGQGWDNYNVAWSIVDFLCQTPAGVDILEALLKDSREVSDPVKVVERNYPGGVAQLENDWHAHIKHMAGTR